MVSIAHKFIQRVAFAYQRKITNNSMIIEEYNSLLHEAKKPP